MPTILIQPANRILDVPPGTPLLEALRTAGVEADAPCGGKGTCGKCLVRITAGDVDPNSAGTLPHALLMEGYVLACRAKVRNTPLTVEVPEPLGAAGKFSDTDETHLVRQELLPKDADFDPLAVKWLLRIEPPQLESGLSDLDRVTRAIQKDWGQLPVQTPLPVLRKIAGTLRSGHWTLATGHSLVTATLIRESDRLHLIRIEPGDTTTRHFGLAIDVGTTTIAVQLINLSSGQILATRTDYNGQIPCGLDVISRINYAGRKPAEKHLEELRSRVLKTINKLLLDTARSRDVAPGEICNAVVSGNTTMTHLLLGLDPEYIRLHPYSPTILHAPYLTADEIGLGIHPDSWVYLSPAVGSYVGGDITAGILGTDLAGTTDEVNLFVDIGTNGELVIGNKDFLVATACSAGPAFEGAGIDCGMRAATGAIEKATVDPVTGVARFQTIGNVPPRGICGSGMIDLLASLLRTGWIDPAGKLDRSRPSPAIQTQGKRARYILVPGATDAGATGLRGSQTRAEATDGTATHGTATVRERLSAPHNTAASTPPRPLGQQQLTTNNGQLTPLPSSMQSVSSVDRTGEGSKEIYVTETDIENIIRAKAAIYSACALLLKQLDLDFTALAHVYIAGGFGRFLDLEQAITIGLLPDIPREKFHYIGNSSLLGSYIVAVSQRFREKQIELARRMTYVELSTDPAYMDQYTAALFLPHTDPTRFPSVRRSQTPAETTA